jgi:acetyl-CoA carboxylase biotin carboxylase subunit
MFTKLLIANRGEIAVRIIRACREMGIETVAVFSEADRHALHVQMADEAVFIGLAPASHSYLSIENIIQAAISSRAQAVHPGYGFLSENSAFAQAVLDAGLTFIGPPPEAIRVMGDKAAARAAMQSAGVTVVPGYQGPDEEVALLQAAGEIGYPVMVKAAAGGGGKGMRIVRDAAGAREAIETARREAQHAFGDGGLLLERYIPRAHHIEFQILADGHGNTIQLFERECSVQRRHQKIIEETPSPNLDADLRLQMGAAAVTAARAVGYQNAGTVEFIFDPNQRTFYFLEMNTRLQVEHAITEAVTGLDLVQWQIRIASGERLPFTQEQVNQRGHAIECRLYAEDPANNYLPAAGVLLRFAEPGGPGIRVDSGFTDGDEITLHYDPLIAKLIVSAEDRPAAIRKMRSALRETAILGLTTNWQFLQDVLAHPVFEAGRIFTTWIEDNLEDWQPSQCDAPVEVLIGAALAQFQPVPRDGSRPEGPGPGAGDPFSPWNAGDNFRAGE